MRRLLRAACVLLLLIPFLAAQSEKTAPTERTPVLEALDWMNHAQQNGVQYDYAMTARVRLLFFWAGKDDVGGGYIRHGFSKADAHEEQIGVLFGSDPAKAPRAINRWGAGTEFIRHATGSGANNDVVSSVFFGFMKSSKGKSVGEMQEELKKEKEHGEFQFTGILSRVEEGRTVSLTQPLSSNTDYNLNQYNEAQPIMVEKLRASERPVRTLKGGSGCARNSEFLGTVSELLTAALENRSGPKSLCYVYDAQVHTLTLVRANPMHTLQVTVHNSKGENLISQNYQDVLEAEFISKSQDSSKQTSFSIVMGTKDALRGVPLQIRYQPNWWFQVVLNLKTTHPLG